MLGYRIKTGRDRTSSPIFSFDCPTRTATTASGNRYVLFGAASDAGLGDPLVLHWLVGPLDGRWLADVLTTAGSYEELLAACIARRHELGLSQLAVEEISGLQGGYLGPVDKEDSQIASGVIQACSLRGGAIESGRFEQCGMGDHRSSSAA